MNNQLVRWALGLLFLAATGCKPAGENPAEEVTHQKQTISSVFAFESPQEFTNVALKNALMSTVKYQSSSALKVEFLGAKNHQSQVSFLPKESWNWTTHGEFGVSLEISNPNESSVHVYVSVRDEHGAAHNRSVVIPAESSNNYLIELAGPDLNVETGIRSNPFSWQDNYQPIIWRNGNKNIDLSAITSITFKVIGVPENKVLIFDNINLVKPGDSDPNYLADLVDKYGQNNKLDFANKVSSDAELLAISEKEQAWLAAQKPEDRSQFFGWQSGPKLKATGFYRVEKYQGKWTLVDPQGYLFYSNGIANVRMANTSTITGYDFDQSYIKQRSPGDLTPEDSIGLNKAPKSAWPTRKISSNLRADMFTWLPNYEEPMGQHFGYRRQIHTGAIPRGETYSFYQANLARKYQTNDLEEINRSWQQTTLKRMQSWGFTSFGNWVDPEYYQKDEFPYFANGWIIGNFKTVSSGNDYWAPLPDPFDPVFKERAFITVEQIASEVQNSPWCVGVFIDNEKSWGQMGTPKSQYAVALGGLAMDAQLSPTKAHFSRLLKNKYQSIEKLNLAWQTTIDSWQAFDQGVKLSVLSEQIQEDLSVLLYEFADQYFAVVNAAMDHYMPNHLYLGARFADWGMTPELRKAAAKSVDVMSYNYYKEVINHDFWQFLEGLDMPSIIGEFHNGAIDSGLLNAGLISAESQTDRGKKYQEYVNSALDNPYFVGTHWFQYIDSPLTGRALDGENYNVGFVSVTDIPYQPLVDAAMKVNKRLYQRRYGNDKQ